ncbi:MAG: S8 family serine peptidase [Elusimicrobia bacterium]|nr:S8 family serine peptidase [Elusimicrobiota bacterium]
MVKTLFFRKILLFLAALLPALAVSDVFAVNIERMAVSHAPSAPGAARLREVISGAALVKFSSGTSSETKTAILAAAGFEIARELDFIGWTLVKLPPLMSVAAGLALLKAMPAVTAAEPNGVYRVGRASNDPLLAFQYGLNKTDAFRAWEYETGFSSRVTVAVLDTGIDGSHPELAPKLVAGSRHFDATTGTEDPADPLTPACNHATRVSGLAAAAADNASGIAGISWGAKLISLKIFNNGDCNPDCSPATTCGSSDAAIISAINYAVTLHNSAATGKIVVNMSIGDEGVTCGGPLQTTVNNAVSAGLLLVAAAGNNPSVAVGVDAPANCTGVIPAGATDISDNLAPFSARGPEMASRGVTAPGGGIYTTDLNGAFADPSGTSFAAPFVSAVAALIWSAKPALTNAEVGDALRNSSDDLGSPGPDNYFGFGRVNAYKAILLAKGLTASGSPQKAYAYPNPYRVGSDRLLLFSIPAEILGGGLAIEIYSAEGEKVRKLTGLSWDGKNEAGRWAAGGVYLFLVKTDKGKARGKFALIR